MVFKKFFKILKRAFRLKTQKPHRKKKRYFKKHRKAKKRILRRLSVRRKLKFRKRKRAKKPLAKRRRFHQRKKIRILKRKKKIVSKKKKVIKDKLKQIPIGMITHYFPKVHAAVVKLKKPLVIGEAIWIKGKTCDFRQTVGSLQIDRVPIERAKAGQEVGLEVFREVRPGDIIYLSR